MTTPEQKREATDLARKIRAHGNIEAYIRWAEKDQSWKDGLDQHSAALLLPLIEQRDEALRKPERMMPVQGGPNVPWRLIAPYESQAIRNHSQTWEELARRSGLDAAEMLCVVGEYDFKNLIRGKLPENPKQRLAAWVREQDNEPLRTALATATRLLGDALVLAERARSGFGLRDGGARTRSSVDDLCGLLNAFLSTQKENNDGE